MPLPRNLNPDPWRRRSDFESCWRDFEGFELVEDRSVSWPCQKLNHFPFELIQRMAKNLSDRFSG